MDTVSARFTSWHCWPEQRICVVVNAPTVNSFKSRLDKFWENCPTFYDYKAN
jgi:hypothetical protein